MIVLPDRHLSGPAILSADGLPSKSVGAELGIHEDTFGKWRRRLLKDRCDGLIDEARPGRPRTND
jgi:transposase